MENKEVDQEKLKKETKNRKKNQILMMLISAGITLILVAIGSMIFFFDKII